MTKYLATQNLWRTAAGRLAARIAPTALGGRLVLTLMLMLLTTASAWATVGDVVDSGTCGDNLTWTLTENGEADIVLTSGTYTALTLTITGTGAMDDYTSSSYSPWNGTNNYRNRVTKLVLPEGITHIGNCAFYFTNFTGKLTIPSTVQTIGTSGFYGFHGATSVTIPASVTSIGEKALLLFGKNASSCTVTFAEGSQLASIGANAFEMVNADLDLRNCTQLTAINAEEVFKAYTKTVTFPRTMTSVCANAFKTVTGGGKPTIKMAYNGFLIVNGTMVAEGTGTKGITSYFNVTTVGSNAVTIYQRSDGLTWNTEGSYYEVNSEQGLVNLGDLIEADKSNTIASMTFKLTADLDFTNMPTRNVNGNSGNFHPIGLVEDDSHNGYFKGHFDGQNHTIKALRYTNVISLYGNPSSNTPVGLFNYLNGSSAVVERVVLIDPQITGRDSGCGGIAGCMGDGATIRNCTVLGGFIAQTDDGRSGGIVGRNSSAATIEGCTVIGTSVQDGKIFGSDTPYQTIKDCIYYDPDGRGIARSNDGYTDGGGNQRVYQLTIGEGITASGATYSHVLVPDKAYYANGSTVTLGHGTREGYVFDGYTASPAQTISDGTFTMPAEDVSVSATWTPDPAHFSVNDAGTEFTIHTATGWGVFCDALQDNDTYNRFSGKTVSLGADIAVSRMAGSGDNPFCGNFDGGGKTLTFTATAADNYCAPFVGVKGGTTADDATTISNLNVVTTITANDYRHMAGLIALQWGHVNVSGCNATVNISSTVGDSNPHDLYPAALVSQASSSDGGTLTVSGCTTTGQIATDGKYAAGLVGIVQGTASISDCVSSVTIQSSTSGDGTHGGIVATVTGSGSIEGCVFNGKLTTTKGTGNCAGFIAWGNGTISNSLYAPADLGTGETEVVAGTGDYPSGTFYRGTAPTVTNSYYTRALGTAQGKATRTVAPATDVTIEAVALTGTATQYTVSGITAYSGGGLQLGETLYYGSGDQLSLTLSNSATGAPLGYRYDGYTASAGTLSGSTLTMPDQDVTISVNTAALAPIDWATVNEGDSEEDPYMIYNKDQLLLLAHRVNGTNGETAVENGYQYKYFKLGADITFSHPADEDDDYAENYEAIGTYIVGTMRYFKGKFDGANHTVSGIRIRKTGTDYADIYQGLFGCIDSGADIYDVHLTDARITGYENVGGIVGYNFVGNIMRCSVTDSYITATGKSYYGTICGSTTNTSLLRNNYYHGCTVNSTAVTSGMGCNGADITAKNGALPAYAITLGENITTPPGTFVGHNEWLTTPPVNPRLVPGNGFTLAGNHYFASGYEFTPGSTLASGAAQGYTPRATLGGQLLDLYTPTGDDDLLAGKAIARLTITADCDGKTLDAAIRSDGQQHDVSYMTADGSTQTAQAVALDGTETSLAAGTYFAGLPTVQFDHKLTLTGNVTLILKDGCEMNVGESDARVSGGGITGYIKTLDIYAQSLGDDMGALSIYTSGSNNHGINIKALTVNGGNITADANGSNGHAISASSSNITINGGTVTAHSAYFNGIHSGAKIYINGGTVNVTGSSHGIDGSSLVEINGGTVNATCTGSGYGIRATGSLAINGGNVTASSIFAGNGTITLGWTRPDDRITASSISTNGGTVAVADGQALTDGSGNIYTGTLTADDLATLADKTLQPSVIALAAREAPDGNYWTTYYNSALGFTINADENACAYTAEYDGANSQLTLHKLGTVIPKGTAVIIVGGDNSISLTASNETATVPTNNLHGVDVRKEKSTLGTGTFYVMSQKGDNFGFFEYTGEYMPARKAYLLINGSAALTRGLTMVFDDETTGIRPTPGPSLNGGEWHDLSGRRLDGKKPTTKGVYIHDGKKVVIK